MAVTSMGCLTNCEELLDKFSLSMNWLMISTNSRSWWTFCLLSFCQQVFDSSRVWLPLKVILQEGHIGEGPHCALWPTSLSRWLDSPWSAPWSCPRSQRRIFCGQGDPRRPFKAFASLKFGPCLVRSDRTLIYNLGNSFHVHLSAQQISNPLLLLFCSLRLHFLSDRNIL